MVSVTVRMVRGGMPVAANRRPERCQPCELCGRPASGESDDRHRVENGLARETADAILGCDRQARLVMRRNAVPSASRMIASPMHIECLIASEVAPARDAVRSTSGARHGATSVSVFSVAGARPAASGTAGQARRAGVIAQGARQRALSVVGGPEADDVPGLPDSTAPNRLALRSAASAELFVRALVRCDPRKRLQHAGRRSPDPWSASSGLLSQGFAKPPVALRARAPMYECDSGFGSC